jgi:hypothetical protein
MLVGNHCMDIVDPAMLAGALFEATGRILRFIAQGRVFFDLPLLSTLSRSWGLVRNGSLEEAKAVLRAEGLLAIYPGGASEALMRPYRAEPYQLKWERRVGFVELALRERATVLFVAGVGIDELDDQTRVPIAEVFLRYSIGSTGRYRGARLGLGALGPHLFPGFTPFPVRITHIISAPLALDYEIDTRDREAVARAQERVWV